MMLACVNRRFALAPAAAGALRVRRLHGVDDSHGEPLVQSRCPARWCSTVQLLRYLHSGSARTERKSYSDDEHSGISSVVYANCELT